MFIIYDLIFLIIALVYLPIYLLRGKFHSGFLSRLGFLPKGLALDKPIWIHAVSVGEVMAIKALVEQSRELYPDKAFVISTVTATGNKIAKSIANEGDLVIYLPLDLSFIVRKVIDRIKPSLFIIAEVEIWPNIISCLHKRNIPVVVVNARISDRSYRGYLITKFLLGPVFKKPSLFCVQADEDARRLIKLGVSSDKIHVTGTMKFDYADFRKDGADFKLKLGLRREEKLFVAGSTHAGEEDIIIATYKEISPEFPEVRLLIAPRHPERTRDVEKVIVKYGFSPLRVSQLKTPTRQRPNAPTVFILDTIGQLASFYACSDIVFVGGSLVKKIGGHNILEPAYFGKPVIFGPYSFKSRDIAELFLNEKAAVVVRNQEELSKAMSYLLRNSNEAFELGERGRKLILERQGATRKNTQYIRRLYGDQGKAEE